MSGGMGRVAEEMQAAVGSWQPESGAEFDSELAGWADHWRTIGAAMAQFASRCAGDLPIGPATQSSIEQFAATLSGLGDVAEDVYTTHRTEHEDEMRRVEDPRPGEPMWDVK